MCLRKANHPKNHAREVDVLMNPSVVDGGLLGGCEHHGDGFHGRSQGNFEEFVIFMHFLILFGHF